MNSLITNGFTIYYQEIVKVCEGKINTIGVEALARFDNVDTPSVIKKLEESYDIIDFGKTVITTVFADYHRLIAQYGNDLIISINVSPIQLDHEFGAFCKEVSEKYRVNLGNIEFEITESVIIETQEVIENIWTLSKLGVRISIDDFGTGFSSMKYIAELPVDTLKIDGHFIMNLKKTKYLQIIECIANLSNQLNLRVVAEHVEHMWQVETLQELGIHEYQGYLYSKPSSNLILIS